MAEFDIFISYRRVGGFETAKHLYDLLRHDGYAVSFDIDTLREGKFNVALLSRIKMCPDFVLIVDPHTFDRTLNPILIPTRTGSARNYHMHSLYKRTSSPFYSQALLSLTDCLMTSVK